MNSKRVYSSTTAILLFARSEGVESTLKPITFCTKQNVLLWKKMNDMVLKTIQKTELPYFISNENNQVGDTFGEKITNSIQEVFTEGFKKVIVVGNDCVALKINYLHDAVQQLQNNNCVLGPDFNGGAYLIGVTQSAFRADEFEQIAWKTATVFSSLQLLFNSQSIVYLPSLDDCNSASDFKRAIYRLPYSSTYRKILLSFLCTPKVQNKFEPDFIDYQHLSLIYNKGSPFL